MLTGEPPRGLSVHPSGSRPSPISPAPPGEPCKPQWHDRAVVTDSLGWLYEWKADTPANAGRRKFSAKNRAWRCEKALTKRATGGPQPGPWLQQYRNSRSVDLAGSKGDLRSLHLCASHPEKASRPASDHARVAPARISVRALNSTRF
jgi:hypothetical protein